MRSTFAVPSTCDSPSRGHFDEIYLKGVWGKSTRSASDFYSDAAWPTKAMRASSASGPGSNLGYATETSLKIIKDAIAKYNVQSMIDVPCGDVNWVFIVWRRIRCLYISALMSPALLST